MDKYLHISRCPWCGIDKPHIHLNTSIATASHNQLNQRIWGIYYCENCGGVILLIQRKGSQKTSLLPELQEIDPSVPERARHYLQEAIATISTPSASVVVSASAVDAMLKNKGYKEGSLNSRIEEAANNHLITDEMKTWAHEVRLEANAQRHADETSDLPTTKDAEQMIEFAKALAEFLFVLPSRVQKGLSASSTN